jgi:hypothetical protein
MIRELATATATLLDHITDSAGISGAVDAV